MTAIEITKTPRPGIGPFREGAGKALFYWSWFMVLVQHFVFILFVSYSWFPIGYDLEPQPWHSPYFILLPYLAGAVLFSIFGGLIKLGLAKRAAKKPQPAVGFGEVYAESFTFIKNHWKHLTFIALPPTIAAMLPMLPIFLILSLLSPDDAFFNYFLFIFGFSTIATILVLFTSQWAVLVYFHRVSESLEINARIIIKKSLVLLLISFLIGLVFDVPSYLLQLALGEPEDYWWGLNAILTVINYIFTIFMFFFIVLYVVKGRGIVKNIRITARFFNAHFFRTIRFTLYLILKLFPAAFLVLLYAFWAGFVSYEFINDGNIIGSGFTVSLMEVLRWPYYIMRYRGGWQVLLPIGAAAFLWLSLVFIIFIKRLDEADSAEAAEAGPLPEAEAKPDGRVLLGNPGV